MPAQRFAFHLSPRGHLRWAIASLLLVAPLPSVLASGVVVAPGPGGVAQLQNQNGVPIIDIVAPNGAGLSHNQFLDYNVDRQGLVLNNALQGGVSQLAGQLAANPQFQGQAASVILNEVISRNASTINGTQEIFGRAADYVLANPNGLSVNGGGFINTPNAHLLVGRPEVIDGKLQALSARNIGGELTVEGAGLHNNAGSINLIAPRIDSTGKIAARDHLNVTVGRNSVDYPSGQVTYVDPVGFSADKRIDARLFGAMQAGRINIISTAEGAGVRVGPVKVEGSEGVQIRSAGDLVISGVAAPNERGIIRASLSSSQGDIGLYSGDDLTLAAIDVSARDVQAHAGRNLTLTTFESRLIHKKDNDSRSEKLGITWETFEQKQTHVEQRHHGNRVTSSRDVQLSSGADMEIKGSKVKAGRNLQADSAGDLRLTAATESVTDTHEGKHRKFLWKENWETREEEQSSVLTELQGDNLTLTAGNLLRTEGARLDSNQDILFDAQRVEITTTSRTNSKKDDRYRGDLVGGTFFGKKGQEDQLGTWHQGSAINASGRLIIKADDVHVTGSQARGATDAAVISDVGSLVVDGVEQTSRSSTWNKDNKFLGIVQKESSHASDDSTTLRSKLSSDSNLSVRSRKDIEVVGSTLKAGGTLTASAQEDVNVRSAQDKTSRTDISKDRSFDAYAKENAPGAGQYRAGVRYAANEKAERRDEARHGKSSLSGAELQVKAGGDLKVKGAELAATKGNVDLSAKTVQLLAENDMLNTSTEKSTTGGGMYVTGGLDRLGSGSEIGHSASKDTTSKSTAQTTSVEGSGQVNIDAEKLVTEGAQVTGKKGVKVTADEVENRVAQNTDSTTHSENNSTVDAGINVEYKNIARPVIGAVKDVLTGKMPNVEGLRELGKPDLGIDLGVVHKSAGSEERNSTALVSQLTGGAFDVNVKGTLRDQGTRWGSNDGALNIRAGQLIAEAASNSHNRTDSAVDAKVDARVYTTTGKDVNVTANGEGGSSRTHKEASTAVVGRYAGNQGVNIELAGNGRFEGSEFDGGNAGVKVETGGTLAMNQANDRELNDNSSLRGSAWVKGGTYPGAQDTNIDMGGGAQLDYKNAGTDSSKARVARVKAAGPVQFNSGGDQLHKGTAIDTPAPIDLISNGKLDLQAATDIEQARGFNLGGGLNLGGSKTSSEVTDEKKGLFNANLSAGRINETNRSQAGGQLKSQDRITLAGDSIHLQGTQPTAPDVRFDAGEGGVNLESALSSKSRDNWNVELKGGGNLGGSTPTAAAPAGVASNDYGFNGLARAGIDNLRSSTSQNSLTKADRVELDSVGDVQLSGARIEAGTVNGKVGGDLTVQSRQDQLNHKRFDVDLGLTGSKPAPTEPDSVAATAPPKAFDYKPSFKFDGEYAYRDSVGKAAAINGIQGVNLAVGGATQLTGARIASPEGSVDLGDSKVGTTTLSNLDHRIKAGLELPQKSTGGAKPNVSNSDLQTLHFGPVSVGSRFDTDSLQAGVEEGKL